MAVLYINYHLDCNSELDPFGGSNVTGRAAENTKRLWLCFEKEQGYLDGSKFRFHSHSKSELVSELA